MTCNPDMQSCIPQIMQLLDQVHSGQQQLLQLWQIKKAKLEQCLQLRIFEQDCEKVKKVELSYELGNQKKVNLYNNE
jgi:hypothetical protein